MKSLITLIVAGSLLATLALAQPLQSTAPFGGDPNAQPFRRQALGSGKVRRASDESESAKRSHLVYVIAGGSQFGTLDLQSGTFLPIGPVPTDLGGGLVPGLGGSLLSLSFNGNLTEIDPATGRTSVVGRTGLVDCSTPSSPCDPTLPTRLAAWTGRSMQRISPTTSIA